MLSVKLKLRSDSNSEISEIAEDELEDLKISPPPKLRRRAKLQHPPGDDEVFENPYPLEGIYKDEDDKEMLLNMTEIEREQVLFARTEEMQLFKEKRDLAALLDRQAKDQPRRSHRDTALRSERAGKRDELSELRKRREQKSLEAKLRVFCYDTSLISRRR
jgi:SNF2 family DNA or RNA helicase